MNETGYLVLNKRGIVGYRKTTPALKRGEIAVRLEVDVPDTLFLDYIPTARLVVDPEKVLRPDISVEITDPPEERGYLTAEQLGERLEGIGESLRGERGPDDPLAGWRIERALGAIGWDPMPGLYLINKWSREERQEVLDYAEGIKAEGDLSVDAGAVPEVLRKHRGAYT